MDVCLEDRWDWGLWMCVNVGAWYVIIDTLICLFLMRNCNFGFLLKSRKMKLLLFKLTMHAETGTGCNVYIPRDLS